MIRIARYYKQEKDIQEGVYVVDIDERGPAYKAGIRVDDIITRVGDIKVTKMLELRSAIIHIKWETGSVFVLLGGVKSMLLKWCWAKNQYR